MDNYFEIYSYDRVSDIKLGMSLESLHEFTGGAKRSFVNDYGTLIELYTYFKAHFKNNVLTEIEFFKNSNIFYKGINLFYDHDALSKILDLVNAPLESDETLLFLDLGFALWGFHKETEGKTVCVFSRGAYDKVLKYFHPFIDVHKK